MLIFSSSVTNSNHKTIFFFSRGQVFTIESLNLDKGKCIFQENPTCAQNVKSTLKRNWTPMDIYKYKSSDPHLDIIMIMLLSLGVAHTSLRLGRRDWFVQVRDYRVQSSHVFRVLVSSNRHALGGFQSHTHHSLHAFWNYGLSFTVDRRFCQLTAKSSSLP